MQCSYYSFIIKPSIGLGESKVLQKDILVKMLSNTNEFRRFKVPIQLINNKEIDVQLPQGDYAGSSVNIKI